MVEVGDILAEVETDKATMELESYETGTMLYIADTENAIPVDGIVAVIGDKGYRRRCLPASLSAKQH